MFWKKIKEKIENAIKDAADIDSYISNYGKEDYDVDAKTAIHNYEVYQNNLNERCRDLIKKWCNQIKLSELYG